ncbi:MAG: c-type cytochrome [Maribacter sp.]|nr:c-type cytochrome [Maribacter sp.]
MRLVSIVMLFLLVFSCNRAKKSEEFKENGVPAPPKLSKDSQIFLGNRLFSEKTCITCHAVDQQKVGPSVIEIITIYKEKNGDIVAFLKGKTPPIVDTTASQVAVMQNNIDGFLKEVSDVELNALATYMLHVDELNKN